VTLSRLVLWRHGETDWNADRRMQGQLDAELSEVGIEQARRAAVHIAQLAPQVLVTSDLSRAASTAAVLAQRTGLPVRIDKRLRETHLGQWQGLTHEDVDARWPGGRATWRGNAEWAPPGGETRVEVAGRARHVVAELDADEQAEVAVLCAHGGLIASLVCSLLELPVDRWPAVGGIGNCNWVELSKPAPVEAGRAQWRLLSYNVGVTQ
jgi:broad specificity phosphatase PhoE